MAYAETTPAPNLTQQGAQRFCGILRPGEIALLQGLADQGRPIRGGRRLYRADAFLHNLINPVGAVGAIAASILGTGARPVRALMFDKTPQSNWSVAWHQDRVIAVVERKDSPGFGPWSVKDGKTHVAPPLEVLGQMITVRAHIDDCGPDNAPLMIALGSHRFGRVPAPDAESVAMTHEVGVCLADAGDVWAYATPILHASASSESTGHRRVLQVDYAAFDLPFGLSWLGIEKSG